MPVFVDQSTLRPGARPIMPRKEWLSGEHVPTATAHTSMVVKRVIRLLEESRARTHLSTSEHFNHTLRLWEAASRRAEMDEWLPLCEDLLRGYTPLVEAHGRLVQHAQYGYEDALGLIYMMLNLGDLRKGQFFTPFAIARMLAEMILSEWKPPYGPAGPPQRFYEPACGSGVMFLGIMAVLEERFPESFPVLLQQGLIQFRGNDLDPTAILMTTLNLRWRGYPLAAETLTIGNALAKPPMEDERARESVIPRPDVQPQAAAPASFEQSLFF